MTVELRCPSKLHGIVVEDDVIEVACTSRFCGYEKGVVVRHRIRISTGEVLSTRKFKEPTTQGKEGTDGTRNRLPVRTA